MNTCRTCRWWEPCYTPVSGGAWGNCHSDPAAEKVLPAGDLFHTRKNFGCRFHEPLKDKKEKT